MLEKKLENDISLDTLLHLKISNTIGEKTAHQSGFKLNTQLRYLWEGKQPPEWVKVGFVGYPDGGQFGGVQIQEDIAGNSTELTAVINITLLTLNTFDEARYLDYLK